MQCIEWKKGKPIYIYVHSNSGINIKFSAKLVMVATMCLSIESNCACIIWHWYLSVYCDTVFYKCENRIVY